MNLKFLESYDIGSLNLRLKNYDRSYVKMKGGGDDPFVVKIPRNAPAMYKAAQYKKMITAQILVLKRRWSLMR